MFDYINSKKYIILLFSICIIFLILVAKAFEYLPSANNTNINKETEAGTQSNNDQNDNYNENENSEYTDDDDGYTEEERRNRKNLSNNSSHSNMQEDVDEVEAPRGSVHESNININNNYDTNNAQDEIAVKAYLNARNLLSEGKRAEALTEFENAQYLTQNKELLALIYQGIALTYANEKIYETALSYANKAVNISPSLAGQVLIVKIYKASGQTEQAKIKLNNIIQQEFTSK